MLLTQLLHCLFRGRGCGESLYAQYEWLLMFLVMIGWCCGCENTDVGCEHRRPNRLCNMQGSTHYAMQYYFIRS